MSIHDGIVDEWDYVIPSETMEYYRFVVVVLSEVPAGIYGMDQKRAELHEAMCARYGLTSEKTKPITGNLDEKKFKHGADGLHKALQQLRRELK